MPITSGKPKRRAGKPKTAEQPELLAIRDSEAEAYEFIRRRLREIGWSVKNPSLGTGGQVWTQNQCLAHPEIKRCLGLARPENVIQLSETKLWVIEAKNSRSALKRALYEAENDYAWLINNGGRITVPVISGVAGNDSTGYEVRTRLLVGGEYKPVTINGCEATGLLDPKTIEILLSSGNPDIADLVIDETVFLTAAESINRALHIGGINKNDRAKVMAALLLSMLDNNDPDVESDLLVLIDDINTRTKSVLRKHGKVEFHPFVKIETPTSHENHVKFKAAIVQTLQTLNNLSIKSAMNSGADILGKFYEVFLKYGNGAKEIGIVLTPRHITKFAVETVGVGPNDLVYDCACGTGGFLVAAFDHVRKIASSQQIEKFKKHNLFGIEQESYVAALAIVNMIFRGDGKNNIVEGNCFSKFLTRSTVDGYATARYVPTPPTEGNEPITRVFMNPPFALKQSDEQEFLFVETALKSMATGGLLFAIVPMSVMSEGGKFASWRRDTLLGHNTLLSVLSFPEELFYPVSNQTVAVVVRRGIPHAQEQPVLWGRVSSDGFQKSKGKRLPITSEIAHDLQVIEPILRGFLADPSHPIASIPEFVCTSPIDYTDPITELVPEAYLESRIPSRDLLMKRLDAQVRDTVASLVSVDLRHVSLGRPTIIDAARNSGTGPKNGRKIKEPKFKAVPLSSLFEVFSGDYHSLGEIDAGDVPMVSCGDMRNGIVGFYDVPAADVYKDALTIAYNGRPLTTKIHPYRFAAKDDVAVAISKLPMSPETLIFIQAALNSERWRFSYYRKCFRAKLKRLQLELPVDSRGRLDEAYIASVVRAQDYWWFLEPRLLEWQPHHSHFNVDKAKAMIAE
jgi:type I restriction enzyme M protein